MPAVALLGGRERQLIRDELVDTLAANFASSDGVVIEAWVVSTTSGPLPVNSMNASSVLSFDVLPQAHIIKSANRVANKGLARSALDPSVGSINQEAKSGKAECRRRWTWRLLMAFAVDRLVHATDDGRGDPRLAVRSAARRAIVPAEVWGAALPPRRRVTGERIRASAWSSSPRIRRIRRARAPRRSPRSRRRSVAGANSASCWFAGLLDQFNLLRGFVIEGVRDFVVRARSCAKRLPRTTRHWRRCQRMAAPKWRRGGGAIWKPGRGIYGAWTMPWRKRSSSAIATRISTVSCAG